MADRVKAGIASHEELRARAIAIAKGKRRRQPDEPKIWLTSLESLARVLSELNRELLRIIAERRPGSLKELEALTGRRVSNLSRTLRTMSRYGLVRLELVSAARSGPRCWSRRCSSTYRWWGEAAAAAPRPAVRSPRPVTASA